MLLKMENASIPFASARCVTYTSPVRFIDPNTLLPRPNGSSSTTLMTHRLRMRNPKALVKLEVCGVKVG